MRIRDNIINIANGYVGYREGKNNDTIFGIWYPMNYNPWCAMFVSYCIITAGVSEYIMKRFASSTAGMNWFKAKGQFKERGYQPQAGDIVFITWSNNYSSPDHTGLVKSCDGNKIYTIEGNRDDCVAEYNYDINSANIVGFGCPNYDENSVSNEVISNNNESESNSIVGNVATIQTILNSRYGLNIRVDNLYGNETHGALVYGLQKEIGVTSDKIFGNITKSHCPNIRKGNAGNIVWLIQAMLICKGYSLSVDGDFGSDTDTKVKDFQAKNGLVVDGIVGKNTFEKLFK